MIQEVEYARKDFQRAVGALLLSRGVDMDPILSRGARIQTTLHYGNIEQDGIPHELKEWIAEAYHPRSVGVHDINLGLSSHSEYGPHGRIIVGVNPWASIDVGTYGPNTEEEIKAEQAKVIISDPEVFGLPVEHEVHVAESLRGYKGIILPDKNIVMGRHTLLVLNKCPMIWRRGFSSLEEWAKDNSTLPPNITSPTIDAEVLEITIVRSLINHILEISKGNVYAPSSYASKRNIAPRVKIEIY